MRCKTLFSLSSMRHRYASKVEKPLRAPVCFFIEHVRSHDAYVKTYNDITSPCFARNIKDSKIQQCDDNENAHALPSLNLKKKRDCSQSTFHCCLSAFAGFGNETLAARTCHDVSIIKLLKTKGRKRV